MHRCFLLSSLLLCASFAFPQTPPSAASRPASTGEVSRSQEQTASAFDYLPLQAGARYTYSGVYERRDTGASARDVFTFVTKGVIKDGTDVFYFVEEEKRNSAVQMLDVNMVGLGAYAKGPEGFGRLYVSAESGIITIFEERGRNLEKIGEGFFAPSAHTVAVDSRTHRVYFPHCKTWAGNPFSELPSLLISGHDERVTHEPAGGRFAIIFSTTRNESAEIVRDGFTPKAVGMIEASAM